MARKHSLFSFKAGFVQSRDVLRVIGQVDQLAKAGSSATRTMKWTRADGKWSSFELEWTATRLWARTAPELEVYATGPAGFVLVASAKGEKEERVDDTPQGPKGRGHIRDLRWIGNHLYAAGMSRQVYRRMGPGAWERRDAGTVLELGTIDPVAGFNSLDGMSEDDFLGAGFGGEIWRCRKGKWKKLDVPTNVLLSRVRVVSEGKAFAAGQKGTILRGDGDRWTVIEHEETHNDIWGMEWFKDSLYVATESALYRVTGKGDVEPVKLPKDMTCMHLHAADGILWSTGAKNVAWTDDTVTWNDLTP